MKESGPAMERDPTADIPLTQLEPDDYRPRTVGKREKDQAAPVGRMLVGDITYRGRKDEASLELTSVCNGDCRGILVGSAGHPSPSSPQDGSGSKGSQGSKAMHWASGVNAD